MTSAVSLQGRLFKKSTTLPFKAQYACCCAGHPRFIVHANLLFYLIANQRIDRRTNYVKYGSDLPKPITQKALF
jgi:hypothetical protein